MCLKISGKNVRIRGNGFVINTYKITHPKFAENLDIEKSNFFCEFGITDLKGVNDASKPSHANNFPQILGHISEYEYIGNIGF